jgi:hypothetical protein
VSSNFLLPLLRVVATEKRYVDYVDTFYVTTGGGGYNNLLVGTMSVKNTTACPKKQNYSNLSGGRQSQLRLLIHLSQEVLLKVPE